MADAQNALPTNQASFTLSEALAATRGRLVHAGAERPALRVNTDTRSIAPNDLFVALQGERFDAHDYIGQALTGGATIVVVCDARAHEVAHAETAVIAVADTAEALGALAREHRRRWASKGGRRTLIAIGGSAGKTTMV